MRLYTFAALLLVAAHARAAEPAPIQLEVDATETGRRLVHSRVVIPASAGPLTLYYPKWVPGTHGPTTPIADLAGFRVRTEGKDIPWSRDELDPYAVRVTVPADAMSVEVTFDLLLPGLGDPPRRQNTVASAKLAVLNLCDLLVYPKSATAMKLPFAFTLKIPSGWKQGSALPISRVAEESIAFGTVSLETLIDSPVLCGQYAKVVPIGPKGGKHRVFLACDSEAGLEVPQEMEKAWNRLVEEADKLFGSKPFGSYTFLLALSDKLRSRGLEHHESSDNRLPEMTLSTPHLKQYSASLFPHEYVHAWCGKFRRPTDMIVPDFQRAPKTKMLWVYEGLTNYLGWVLAARSGLWSAEEARDHLAMTAEGMKNTRGRAWRSLEDTAATSHLLVEARGSWGSYRRSLDYYDEGTLLWLEADVIIRRETKGAKSLDDFCKSFFKCPPGRPEVKGYSLDDVSSALDEVAPFKWKDHFTRRVTLPSEEVPLDGLTLGGWNLGYGAKPSEAFKAAEKVSKSSDLTSSLGLRIGSEGSILDAIPDSPAAKAGIGPGMKIVAVNGRRFTPELLLTAIATAGKLELLLENGDFFTTKSIPYSGGPRYPKLERSLAEPDSIGAIIKAK